MPDLPTGLYDTRILLGLISVQKPVTEYWLSFFPRIMTFDSMEIMFDMVAPDKRLAPFVSRNVAGPIQRRRGATAKVFRPAYAKSKHVVEPSQTMPRYVGANTSEALLGSLTREQRRALIVAENMAKEKEQIMRRWEWMAARAVIDGEITVHGDDYPSTHVDFGRDSTLTSVLVSTEGWNQTTGTPLDDIGAMVKRNFDLANAPIDRLTFGTDAWAAFASNPQVTPLLSTQIRGSDTEFTRAVVQGAPWNYMGFLAGQGGLGRLDLYTYSDTYEDDDGFLQPFLDPESVVGTGSGLDGVRCFGAIEDFDAGLAPVSMFPKMWRENEPSREITSTVSAPLMVPAQPNGSFRIDVVT